MSAKLVAAKRTAERADRTELTERIGRIDPAGRTKPTTRSCAYLPSLGRRMLWRSALAVYGGVRVDGTLPGQACVIVANHSSHADTAALLATVPAWRRPTVAAAADYWFAGARRRLIGRVTAATFPVRRAGGGSADLAGAVALLATGHDVIVFPEGTRSRDGSVGEFHTGAQRLADLAGVPLVPVGIHGTRELLPVHGHPHRAVVTIRIGTPVATTAEAARAVGELRIDPGTSATHRVRSQTRPAAKAGATRRSVLAIGSMTAALSQRVALAVPLMVSWGGPTVADSPLRQRLAAFARSRAGLIVVGLWSAAEALSWPILPEFALAVLGVAAPRQAPKLALTAAVGSLLGGIVTYLLAARGIVLPSPLTTPRMHRSVAQEFAAEGAAAVNHQPFSGIPYKVYAAGAGHAQVGLPAFVAASIPARGLRIVAAGLFAGVAGAAGSPMRRWYPAYLAMFCLIFALALRTIVMSWS